MNSERLAHKPSLLKRFFSKSEVGTLLPLLLLCAVIGAINPNFFSLTNILDILRTSSFAFIVAVPVTFLMASGGMDLSIGAATSFGGIVCGFALKAGLPIPLAILLAMLAGALIGVLNGTVIVYCGLPSFITTLGSQYIFNGVIAVTTSALAISGFSNAFKSIGLGRLFGVVPLPVLYALCAGVIGHVLLQHTKFGRSVLAIGGNAETAYLAGINVKRIRLGIYIMTPVMAALSGVFLAARFATAQPNAGTGTELTIMASVIIGGTSMYGGSGTIVGSALGCILLSTIQNALIVVNISTFWQNLIFGIILLVSIFIDKYRRKAGGGE